MNISQYKNVPVRVAAELLGVSPQYIRVGLQRQLLPIGSAVQISTTKWTYQISPGLLKKYMTGVEPSSDKKEGESIENI